MNTIAIPWMIILLCVAVLPARHDANASNIRPVVIEEFTGTWCTYCYGAGMALDRLHEEYDVEQLLIIGYHCYDQLSISFNEGRVDYYQVNGFPTVMLDGIVKSIGGSRYLDGETGISAVYANIKNLIETEQTRIIDAQHFEMVVEGRIGLTESALKLTVTSDQGYPRDLELIVLVVENHVTVPPSQATNGKMKYNSVVRAHLAANTISVTAAGTIEIRIVEEKTIACQSADNLQPIVFLQDYVTKEIVGAVGQLTEPVSIADWSVYQ